MNWARHLPLATRMTSLFGAVALVVFTIAGIHLHLTLAEQLQTRDDEIVQGIIAMLRQQVNAAPSVASLRADPQRILDITRVHAGARFALRDANRSLIVANNSEGQRLTAEAAGDRKPVRVWFSDDGPTLRPVAIWTTAGGRSGEAVQIIAAYDDLERNKMLYACGMDMIWTVALGVIAMALSGYIIARRTLRPVAAIARTAGEITANQLNERLSVEDAPAELQAMVQAFNGMLDRLQDSFARLTQFSSDLAHDLRTPLSNLLVETQIILGRRRSAAEYENLLASNIEELERLSRMTEDMLLLAKVDNPATTIEGQRVDLRAELDKVVEFYSSVAEERGIAIICEGSGAVAGDKGLLQRAIHNLLSNAVRYSTAGGAISAVISRVAAGRLRLSISNTGETIAAKHVPRLFDRFYRADEAREKSGEGSGLGLAIVKSIAQLHRGTISVRSVDGLTTFMLDLPEPDGRAALS